EKCKVGSNWKTYIDSFIFGCRIRNLAPRTLNVYAERLGYLVRHLEVRGVDIEAVSRQDIQDYLLSLIGIVSDETVNGRIRVYRRFFNYLEEEGLWEKPNPTKKLKLVKVSKRIKPVILPDQIQEVLQSLNKSTYEGYRNLTMVLLFWDAMIRKEELITLTVDNVDLRAGLIKVYGKGRKERQIPMGAKTIKTVHFYLNRWRNGRPGDLVFCQRNGKEITSRHCHKIIQEIGKKAKINLYPHLIRHSAATFFIRQGGSPVILQKILGHTSLVVTQNYLHMSNQDMIETYGRFSPSNTIKV
ncbi:MAG TPA: tyrosine-type recombinase/integrase, partial [candidate division Zixibacteria bacterium]|nr:tyrosine-type recombinase/integrase [candidate division Zixibacteria bacterium]